MNGVIEMSDNAHEFTLLVPASYWDDFSDRCPVDLPSQMPVELGRQGRRVKLGLNAEQLEFLRSDAEFYAQGNTDYSPRAVVSGA